MASEAEIIDILATRCATRAGVTVGIGDDAAVLAGDPPTVIAHDMLVENVHFRRATADLVDIGAKALSVNISDLAAMGARPVAALVGLGVPSGMSGADVDALYRGLEAVAGVHRMTVAGGDVSSAPVLVLAVTVVGAMAAGVAPVLRSGARVGDTVFVSGPLGGAAAGLAALEDPTFTPTERAAAVSAHLRPAARVDLGQRLAALGAHAMMDCSDGLALDLSRLAAASGVAVTLDLTLVPRGPGVEALALHHGRAADEIAATGGEDYELIVCLEATTGAALEGLTAVGRVTAGPPGLTVVRGDQPVVVASLGWEHST